MPLVMLELLASAAGMRRMHAGAHRGPAKTLVDRVLAFALPDGTRRFGAGDRLVCVQRGRPWPPRGRLAARRARL